MILPSRRSLDLASVCHAQVVSDWGFTVPYSRELYDLANDPEQLDNRIGEASESERRALHERMDAVWRCSGDACP